MPASQFYSKVLQHWEMEEWRQEAVSMRRPTPSWVHLGCGGGEKEGWRQEAVSMCFRPAPSWVELGCTGMSVADAVGGCCF